MTFSSEDREDLRCAKRLLEGSSVGARLANAIGQPLDKVITVLPHSARDVVTTAVNRALEVGLDFAIKSLGSRSLPWTATLHKIGVAGTGAAGGAFGLGAIAMELPVSTTLMLRSIAEIAQSEGEALESTEARLACLQVFALGGPAARDDAVDAGYFTTRAVMAEALREAAEFVATHGVTTRGAPVVVRFLAQVAARFGVTVSEKVVLQSLPVIGALGGAAINVVFLTHFQDLARGHFTVRRLERKHGPEAVRTEYEGL